VLTPDTSETPDAPGIIKGDERDPMTRVIVAVVLLVAVAFNLVLLYPEITSGIVAKNDAVMHLLLVEMAVEAIENGLNFTDPWQGTMNLGFPFFHYYQHLPHLLVALFHVVTFGVFPVADLIRWSTYLLLSLFPLTIFWSLRRVGFDDLTAGMGALVAPLAATDSLFGFGYASYTFLGFGLYSQLWAMALFAPAIALGYGVIRDGRGYFWATLLLAALLMSHLMYGYMAFISLGVLALVEVAKGSTLSSLAQATGRQWLRLIILLLLVSVVTSYFLIPFILDLSYVNNTQTLLPIFKDSLGHSAVLRSLVEGDLFDFHRFPSLTILVLAGLGVCLVRWRQERYLIPVAIFLVWLLLYFGRSTWGPLIDLLPLSSFIPMHRFIAGVHLGGILLAAVALAAPWRWAISGTRPWYVAGALVFTVIILVPAYVERSSYASENSFVIEYSGGSLAAEKTDLDALFQRLKQLPPGRVYSGPVGGDQGTWGLDYNVGFVNVFSLLSAAGIDTMGAIYHSYPLQSGLLREFDESKQEQYDLFNITYVVAPEKQEFPGFVRLLEQFGRHRLYQVETTGYFGLVDSRLAFSGDREDFAVAASDWLDSDLPAARYHPMVSLGGSSQARGRPVPLSDAAAAISGTPVVAGPLLGEILSEEIGGNFYAADVRVELESLLLLKATYHPNWRATVNGVGTDTVMLMPGFIGVPVGPGEHQVRLEYSPRRLRIVLLVLGLVTLVVIPLVERRSAVISTWLGSVASGGMLGAIGRPRKNESRQSRRRRNRR
jgi:hypothetical protein